MRFSTKAAMQRCTVLAESLVLPAIMRVEASGFAFTKWYTSSSFLEMSVWAVSLSVLEPEAVEGY